MPDRPKARPTTSFSIPTGTGSFHRKSSYPPRHPKDPNPQNCPKPANPKITRATREPGKTSKPAAHRPASHYLRRGTGAFCPSTWQGRSTTPGPTFESTGSTPSRSQGPSGYICSSTPTRADIAPKGSRLLKKRPTRALESRFPPFPPSRASKGPEKGRKRRPRPYSSKTGPRFRTTSRKNAPTAARRPFRAVFGPPAYYRVLKPGKWAPNGHLG